MPPLRALKLRNAEEREWAFNLAATTNPDTGQPLTNAQCRGEIRERLGISLGSDSSYVDFRQWHFRQRHWDVLGDLASQDEQTLSDRFPNLSRDQIRDAVLKRQYAVAELQGDPEFTLKVIRADQAESSGQFKAELEKAKLALAREAEDRARKEHELQREKFEFDAATAAKQFAAEIKAISANSRLNESEKIDAIRQRLFGTLPPAQEVKA